MKISKLMGIPLNPILYQEYTIAYLGFTTNGKLVQNSVS
jgi:hypothetical protein